LTISEGTNSSSVTEVENKVKESNHLSEKLHSEMKEVLGNIKDLHQKVESQKQNPEAFSRITKDQNEKKYNQVTEELNQRLSDLEKENKKQHEHEKILGDLLNLCKDYIIFVEKSLKDIAQDSEGTEEEKLDHVEKYSTEALQTSAKKLEGIKSAATLVEDAEISEKAEYSYQEMESLGDQIKNSSKKRINALQEQVFQKKNWFCYKRTN